MNFSVKINLIVLIFIIGIVIAGCSTNNGKSDDLYLGIMNGNLEQVKEAIADGADLNELSGIGQAERNPLRLAVREDQEEIAEYLVKQDINVNYSDSAGFSILMYCAQNEREKLCKLLLERGADINQKDDNGYCALDYALQSKAMEYDDGMIDRLTALFLNHGVQIHSKTLSVAMNMLNKRNSINSYGIVRRIVEESAEKSETSNMDSLLVAAILGDVEKEDKLIKASMADKENLQQVVFFTAAFGNVETLNLLEGKGVQLTSYDENNNTPLLAASKFGQLETVKYLLEQGADIEQKNNENYTPLKMAIANNHYETAKYLISNGAQITDRSLYYAAADSNSAMIKLLLNNGYVPTDEAKGNALSGAVEHNNMETAEFLLSTGANINWDNGIGTILENACLYGNLQGVKFLVEHGVNTNGTETKGAPLRIAAEYGYTEIVKHLIKNGADINIKNEDVNINTALRTAASSGYFDIVKLLVENGADLEYRAPIMAAAGRGSRNILEYLIENGADVNYQTDNGFTALMLAAKNGYTDNVKILLKYNADAQLKNKEGQTALDIARETNRKDIIELLENEQ